MTVPKVIDEMLQYLSGAMSRIFGPSDDAYPNTGVQPYDGESRKKSKTRD
jgi:hypothetical protein